MGQFELPILPSSTCDVSFVFHVVQYHEFIEPGESCAEGQTCQQGGEVNTEVLNRGSSQGSSVLSRGPCKGRSIGQAEIALVEVMYSIQSSVDSVFCFERYAAAGLTSTCPSCCQIQFTPPPPPHTHTRARNSMLICWYNAQSQCSQNIPDKPGPAFPCSCCTINWACCNQHMYVCAC